MLSRLVRLAVLCKSLTRFAGGFFSGILWCVPVKILPFPAGTRLDFTQESSRSASRHFFMGPFGLFVILTLSLLAGCAESPSDLAEEAKGDRIKEMYADFQSDFPDVQTVTPDEVIEMQQRDDVIVVDVREPKEQAVSMIPGAMRKAEFESRQEELKGKKVISYCTIGYRSGKYTQRLKEQGWDAYNLPGSILSWVLAGHPVVDEAGKETNKVHVYGKQWDLLPEGYEGVY